jgi:ankyrin repeat protein
MQQFLSLQFDLMFCIMLFKFILEQYKLLQKEAKMKQIRLLCMALAFALVIFGCKKEEPGSAQQVVVKKQPPSVKTIEPVKKTQPAPADTQNKTAETTTTAESARPNEDPNLIKSLKVAAATGDIEKIRSILDAGVDVNVKDNSGASLLHIALLGGQEAAAALLISKGIDTHATLTDGTGALHFAVLRNCKEIAKFLIEDGVDVNAMGANFGTPLHIAARTGQTDIAEMLIANGADVNIKDKRNQTPLAIAKQKNDKAMIELLEKHGAE